MPVSSIILTQNNLLPQPNTFNAEIHKGPYSKLYLPIPNGKLSGMQVALQKLNMYYSMPNVSSSNYQSATVEWPSGAGYLTYQWDLTPNFNYASISQLNDAFQQFCIQNKLYLINGANNVYYISLVANPNSYGCDVTEFVVPSTLGSLTAPVGGPALPTTAKTPKITFKSEFNKLIGYTAGLTLNGGATQTTFNSNFTPQLNPVNSILCSLNIAFNPLALNGSTSILNVFTVKDTPYGSTIVVEPNEIVWYDISAIGSMLIFELFDQNYQPLKNMDPSLCVQLLIRPKP